MSRNTITFVEIYFGPGKGTPSCFFTPKPMLKSALATGSKVSSPVISFKTGLEPWAFRTQETYMEKRNPVFVK